MHLQKRETSRGSKPLRFVPWMTFRDKCIRKNQKLRRKLSRLCLNCNLILLNVVIVAFKPALNWNIRNQAHQATKKRCRCQSMSILYPMASVLHQLLTRIKSMSKWFLSSQRSVCYLSITCNWSQTFCIQKSQAKWSIDWKAPQLQLSLWSTSTRFLSMLWNLERPSIKSNLWI